jgi:hypothetical protein
MNSNELTKLGAEVRKQGGQGAGTSMKDLVFDLDTGEFVQVGKNEVVPANCDIVTEMTREGFAHHG